MFGKKKSLPERVDDSVAVSVIPAEFYAGQSPVIEFPEPTVHKETGLEKVLHRAKQEAPAAPSQSVRPSPSVRPSVPTVPVAAPTAVLTSRKWLLIGSLGLFVIFVAGTTWYYMRAFTPRNFSATPVSPVITPPVAEITPSPVQTELQTLTTTEQSFVTTTPTITLLGGKIDFPPTTLGKSTDTDNDAVTDAEEEMYKTDPKNPDTDDDTYPDGTELFYLYSPIDKAPSKLIDSNLVSEYANPVYAYTLYYPTSWARAEVQSDYSDVLFSTLSGEHVEVRVIDATSTQFVEWFATWAPQENFNQLKPFTTRLGQSGFARADNLVYYFMVGSRVYVLVYNPGADQIINYPATVQLMARSFYIPGAPVDQAAVQNAEQTVSPERTAAPEAGVLAPIPPGL